MGSYISLPSYLNTVEQRYRLVGKRCEKCGTIFFPPRLICLECGHGKMERVKLRGGGTILTYTVIAKGGAPTEFDDLQNMTGEYAVALVKLEEGPTITGQMTVPEACEQLGVGESRFHDLRHQTLQATLEALEPRPLGRPAKPISPEQAEIDTLKAELRRVHADLELAQVEIRLARIHPGLIDSQPAADDLPTKKNARRARQQCQQRRAKRRRRKAK